MNRYKKLAFNSVIFAVGNLGSKLISLLLLPLYTYFLSTGQYGTVDLVTTTLSLILPVFTLSIGDAVLRFVMDKNSNKTIVLNNALVLTICGYAVAWLLYPLFKTILPFNNYLFYFYIMLLTSSVNGSLMQFVRANGQVKTFASIGIISSFVVLTSNIILLVQFHLGVAGYLISLIAADIVSLLILFSIGGVYRFISISLTNLALLKEMIVYSIPLIPNALMWWIMGVSDRYIITFFLGVGANGLYAVANKIPSILSMINSIFFQAWQMSAIEEANSKSKSQFYTNIFNAFATVMFLGTSLLLLSLKTILHYVISPSFFSSWEFVPFLLLGVVFSSFSGFLGTNYIAAKNTVGVFRTSIYGAIVNVGANFLLIPFIGTNGASISTMLSFLVIWLFRIADTKSFVKINYNIKSIIGNLSIIFFQIIIIYSDLSIQILWQSILFLIMIPINWKEIRLLYQSGYGIFINKISRK